MGPGVVVAGERHGGKGGRQLGDGSVGWSVGSIDAMSLALLRCCCSFCCVVCVWVMMVV